MLYSVTNIFGFIGLIILFTTAGLIREGVEWLPGVLLLLLILAIRNVVIEVSWRKEVVLSVSALIIVLTSVLILVS